MKFRAWDKSKQKMLYLGGDNMAAMYSNGEWSVGDEVYGQPVFGANSEDGDALMQGVDLDSLVLYEGDIVRESHKLAGRDREFDITTGTIEITNGCFVLNFGKHGNYTLYERYPYVDQVQSREWSVVGNIYGDKL